MRRTILAFAAVSVSIAPACRRSNPTPPAANNAAPVPPNPATIPTPALLPTPAAHPAAATATAISLSNAPAATAFATREAAIAGLSLEGWNPGTAVATLDFDDDGEADQLFGNDDHCVLVRHSAAGFVAESLAPETATDGVQCLPTVTFGPHRLVAVSATGHETESGRSSTWASSALFAATTGHASARVFEHRVETNNGSQGEWMFTGQPDGTIVVAANPGDDLPAGATSPFYAMYRWDAAQNQFAQASCWSASPAAAPTPRPGCTGTPGASFHLRKTESLTATESATEMPAGSPLRVVSPGTLTRGAARLYCVNTASGEMGYAFLTPGELSGCAAP